ncbi:helix-turn-helix domain-containing protein [Amycolatopsis magusensis]|nr:helix-turn-helix domain-containing protein [Amycolatopsis magusensis]MDI5979578.1 helix-turn-helix domain-containing protein [Amycolatopsis magusensis]
MGVDPDFDQAFRDALGERLRLLRRARQLRREEVCAMLHNDLSIGTLGSYESGARRLTVSRLVELCEVLGTTAHEVLAQVHRDLRRPELSLRVRLKVITQTQDPELGPLQAWALARASDEHAAPDPMIEMDEVTLRQAAVLCGMTPLQLLRRLQLLAPESEGIRHNSDI